MKSKIIGNLKKVFLPYVTTNVEEQYTFSVSINTNHRTKTSSMTELLHSC